MRLLPDPAALKRFSVFLPNRWDAVLFPVVLSLLFAVAWSSQQMTLPFHVGDTLTIHLEPQYLPGYALRSTLRMLLGLGLSLLFAFGYGTIAARSTKAERLMIPLLDILQSVPILGFLSITVMAFIGLFPGKLLGLEAASIFAIFTSQAWNMAFSFYHSLRAIPDALQQAAFMLRLSPWLRFWRLDVPCAIPALVWNAMLSVSGGWFFIIASEAITIRHQTVMLPGIGSYMALAIVRQDIVAIGYAVLAMGIVILLFDQLLFRLCLAWAEKFKFETASTDEAPRAWLLTLIRRTHIASGMRIFGNFCLHGIDRLLHRLGHFYNATLQPIFSFIPARPQPSKNRSIAGRLAAWGYACFFGAAVLSILVFLIRYVLTAVPLAEIEHVLVLGLYTGIRVLGLLIIATLIWTPIGVWIGISPVWARRLQPLILLVSAFPIHLLFPMVVIGITYWQLNPEIWLSLLMMAGAQWYILFNIIGGASRIPADLREAAKSLSLRGKLQWKRLWLPAVFPAYVTGGLTACGGAWNASVVAEAVSWGTVTLSATGIGAYIAQQTAAGDQPRVALGVGVMVLYVLAMNRLLWRRLHRYANVYFVQS